MIHSRGPGGFLIAMVLAALAASCELPAPDPPPWPERIARGVDYVAWTAEGYGSEESFASLRELRETGATDVAILVTAYLEHSRDSTVEEYPDLTPTRESVVAALREARSLGLRTAIKPHVNVFGGFYRGMIRPHDPSLWFETYSRFLLSWAEVAESEGCASLWVATELESMTRYLDEWEELIAEVRGVYSGELVYVANWTDLEAPDTLELFRMVDAAGVDAYSPLSDWEEPSVTDLVVAWHHWLWRLDDVTERTDRPVIITEVGCASRRGAAIVPWREVTQRPVDLDIQARYYEAALRALPTSSAVQGIYFWGWGIGPAGPDDGSHSPRGKPAAETLRRFWGEPR